MNRSDRHLLLAISRLATCNPFSPTRFEIEKEILGDDSEPLDSVAWNRTSQKQEGDRPNVVRLTQLAAGLVEKILKEKSPGPNLRDEYWDVATYLLLYRHITCLPVEKIWNTNKQNRILFSKAWNSFWIDYQQIFGVDSVYPMTPGAAAHLFACLMQIHRAFFNIFDHILGGSLPISRLRESVWESIFTCCIHRYHDCLFDRMRDLSTLVTGPSGTGKELVARAIGLSQYVPFEPETCEFQIKSDQIFLPLNLSAMSPTLVESELFGHRKGAFTGAVVDRAGWLESCSKYGAVFLDEIGELDVGLQVKLLRVVQQRTYIRLGDTKERAFDGKIIAATNRNLSEEISTGRFREDFYYRICTDRIETPSLGEQLGDRPEDLAWLVKSILTRHLNMDGEQLANSVTSWISENLGDDYPWCGNIRELEQCVSSYIIRQHYTPMDYQSKRIRPGLPEWLEPVTTGSLTAEQLLCRYCTWLYWQHGSYEKTSRIMKIDRRTVKSKIDLHLLEELQS